MCPTIHFFTFLKEMVSLLSDIRKKRNDNASSYVYIMHEGTIKAQGNPDEIKGSSEISEAYLGI
jgi:ABC-type branched-subunit amino acid transport system ATPase component